jgi:hypothetical protein
MSEETTTATIEEQEVLTQVQDETTGYVETPTSELSELDSAIQRRMGSFELTISPSDLKYIKNLLNNKVEWKGPNEAYLILMSLVSLSSALNEVDDKSTERTTLSLPSTTLESINFFLGKITGKGEESAHRLFAVSMLLRPAMEEIKKLDEVIERLQSEKN